MAEPLEVRERLHDIGNSIAIARANVEAMVDGVLEPSPQRLRNVAEALQAASLQLEQLRERL